MGQNTQDEFYGQQAREHDEVFDVKKVSAFLDAGNGTLVRQLASTMSLRTVTVGTTMYVGKAAVGSSTSSAVWQVQKIDMPTGSITITWADGNPDFDNVWDNYASLTYL